MKLNKTKKQGKLDNLVQMRRFVQFLNFKNEVRVYCSLVSWVRIPFEVWMYVHVFLHVMPFCVGTCLAKGRSPVRGILR